MTLTFNFKVTDDLLKGQILAIFSHFGPVLMYTKLDIFGLIVKNRMAARDV